MGAKRPRRDPAPRADLPGFPLSHSRLYASGRITHPQHRTLELPGWMRVVHNRERTAGVASAVRNRQGIAMPMRHIGWVD